MAKEYIERSKVVEAIKDYGKDAIEDGQKTLDPVDDILLLAGAVGMIRSADVVEIQHEIKTNYDRIRNMSVEELAELLNVANDGDLIVDICASYCDEWSEKSVKCSGNCQKAILKWLESEVEGG